MTAPRVQFLDEDPQDPTKAVPRVRFLSDASAMTTVTPKPPAIDRITGAPDAARLAVAASGSPDDQLKAAQQALPGRNVRRIGKDLVYDDDNGKAVAIEPSFWSRLFAGKYRPSFAGAAETARELTGGALTMAAPAAVTAMAGPEAGLPARMAGAAAANTVGAKIGQGIAKLANLVKGSSPSVDTRTVGNHAVEGLLDAAGGATAELGGAVLPKVLALPGQAVRGTRQGVRSVTKLLGKGEGALPEVTVTGGAPDPVANTMVHAGLVDKNGAPLAPMSVLAPPTSTRARLGNALEQTFAGRPIIQRKLAGEQALESARDAVARDVGNVPAPRDAALAARRVQQSVIDDLETKNKALLSRAFDGTEGEQRVRPEAVQRLANDLAAHIRQDPLSADRLTPALGQLHAILNAAEGQSKDIATGMVDQAGNPVTLPVMTRPSGIPVKTLRNALSDLGSDIGDAEKTVLATGKSKTIGPLKQSYAALTSDVENALGQPTPGITSDQVLAGQGTARDAWDAQRALIKESHNPENPIRQEAITRMLAQGNLRKSLQFVIKADPIEQEARLTALRKTANPDDWNAVASHYISQLGETKTGFSPQKMFEQFSAMTPGAQRALINDPSHLQQLRNLAQIAERFGQNPTSARGSVNNALFVLNKVGSAIQTSAAGAAAGTVGGALLDGSAGGIAGGLAGPGILLGGQYAASRFLSSPTLTKWLTTTYNVTKRSPQSWSAQLGRLLALKKVVGPADRAAIDAYYKTATEPPSEE